jgi:ketosteroid isomerase-like protein
MPAWRDVWVLLLLAVLAAGTAILQNRHTPIATHDIDIRQVIQGQIEAFRRDDGSVAFAFASPDLRAQFSVAPHFMAMIKTHYRAVYRAQKIHFDGPARAIQQDPELRMQNVHLIDDRGIGHRARYTMQKQPDGSWKIAGCHLLQSALIDI